MFDHGLMLTCISLVALLYSESIGSRRGIWISKPLASFGFILTSRNTGSSDLIRVALYLSLIGDVCLIGRNRTAFMAGLCTFLIAHLFFAIGFLEYSTWNGVSFSISAVLISIMSYIVYTYWLQRIVPKSMKWPVLAYVVVITTMVATAFAVLPSSLDQLQRLSLFDLRIPIGAFLFYLSDLCVARQAFGRKQVMNKLIGLPLYYTAQMMLAYETDLPVKLSG